MRPASSATHSTSLHGREAIMLADPGHASANRAPSHAEASLQPVHTNPAMCLLSGCVPGEHEKQMAWPRPGQISGSDLDYWRQLPELPSKATVRLLTAVPTSGTSSQLQALAVRSQTRMFPCWSPAQHTSGASQRGTPWTIWVERLTLSGQASACMRNSCAKRLQPVPEAWRCTVSLSRARRARLLA